MIHERAIFLDDLSSLIRHVLEAVLAVIKQKTPEETGRWLYKARKNAVDVYWLMYH